MKYCKKCGVFKEVNIIDEGQEIDSPWLRFLSPDTKVYGQKYECKYCHSIINDIDINNGVILPLIIIGFVVTTVGLFLFLVFSGII